MSEIGTVKPGFSVVNGNGETGPARLSSLQALPFFLPVAIFPFVIAAAMYGGWWLIGPFMFLLLADQLDTALGTDVENVNPNQSDTDHQLLWFNLAVWVWVLGYFITFIYAFRQVFVAEHLAIWEGILIILSLGAVARMALNAGHDMIHRRTKLERRIGEFLMASVSFPQEVTEHVYVHHTFIGTPKDAVSAPKGQSFWDYLPRSVGRSYMDTWRTERDRLKRRRLPVWHHSNPVWRYLVKTAIWYSFAYWVGGGMGILAFATISAIGIVQLRMVDYMQHYGLQRIRLPNGRYEPVKPRHSWSIAYKLSNWFYYNAQRHADHHIFASRLYPLLQFSGPEQAPQLPGSYSAMGNLVFSPKRWFQTMDPLVDEWRAHFYPEITNWSVYDSIAYRARPDAFEEIEKIHAASPRLIAMADSNPHLLDGLLTREFTDLNLPEGFGPDVESESLARRGLARVYWTHEQDVVEMKSRLSVLPARGVREVIEAIREWSNDKAFQLYMHVVLGNLTPVEASEALSNIAEATINSTLSAVYENYRLQRLDGTIMVALLGDLGGGEAFIDAELDMLFIYEGEPDESIEALFNRFRKGLQLLSQNNLLISRIARQNRTPWIVRTLDSNSIRSQFQHSSNLLLDIAPVRSVFSIGEAGIDERLKHAQLEILIDPQANRDAVKTLVDMQTSVEETDTLLASTAHAGIQEIQRLVRILQLSHSDISQLAVPDNLVVLRTAGEKGLIPAKTAQNLETATVLWRNLHGILGLIDNEKWELDSASNTKKLMIATACRAKNIDDLHSTIQDTATNATAEIETLINQGLH
ncbi:MAG: fatty acid desaturase [Gammaproteobacteria bacterium]|nr:fatty acid desaturase [Gammaproteobacteria bacterium]